MARRVDAIATLDDKPGFDHCVAVVREFLDVL
jgi:hypothetical protein